jgi:hypothetical protein
VATQGTPSITTVGVPAKLVPVKVIVSPPYTDPVAGEIVEITGVAD